MAGKGSESASDRELVITREFDAPRALVYRAWAEGKRMRQWAAPHGFEIAQGEGDAKPGARWRCCMRSPEGEEMLLGGIWCEAVENERLVFTHAWDEDDGGPGHETIMTVRFEDAGPGKTRMHFHQAFFDSAESRDGHRGGWSQGFERLADLLARTQQGC